MYYPYKLALDGAGNLYIADNGNNRIRKVTVATGIITTVAGSTAYAGYNGDGIPATSAWLANPNDVAVDAMGNLYIADTGNYRIRKVATSTGVITTIAGTGAYGGGSAPSGVATSANLGNCLGIAVDGANNVYLADFDDNWVEKVNAAGVISTVAGTGTSGYNGDNIAATSAELNGPYGLSTDGAGIVFIADYHNHRIRKVTVATGVMTTVAGNGTSNFTDNTAATGATLNSPHDMAIDGAGNLDRGLGQ